MIWKKSEAVELVIEDNQSSNKENPKKVSFDDAITTEEIEVLIPQEKRNLWYKKKELGALFDEEVAMNTSQLPVSRKKWEHHPSLSWRGMEHWSAGLNGDTSRMEEIRETIREVVKLSKKGHTSQRFQSLACQLSKEHRREAQTRGALDERVVWKHEGGAPDGSGGRGRIMTRLASLRKQTKSTRSLKKKGQVENGWSVSAICLYMLPSSLTYLLPSKGLMEGPTSVFPRHRREEF